MYKANFRKSLKPLASSLRMLKLLGARETRKLRTCTIPDIRSRNPPSWIYNVPSGELVDEVALAAEQEPTTFRVECCLNHMVHGRHAFYAERIMSSPLS
jgi:hypothetical protein